MMDTDSGMAPAQEAALDSVVADVRAGLASWLDLPMEARITLLRELKRRVAAEGRGIVAQGCAIHGVGRGTLWEGDQWLGLFPMTAHAHTHEVVLSRLVAGQDPLPAGGVSTRLDGQVTVPVFPVTRTEQALVAGVTASVWLEPGVTEDQARAEGAVPLPGDGHDEPGTALILAAGNASALPVTDALSMLFARGCTVVIKLNPVNTWLRPFLERILTDFVAAGWVRMVEGGPEVGAYLAHHDGIDRLHMTGSADTYRALMWGQGEEAARNMAAGTPKLSKPFTAELGGVSPTIVVPGRWRRHDVRRWADRIAYQTLCNCGHLCNSTQILVLPQGWEQGDELLADLRNFLHNLEPQEPFYPGSDARVARAVEGEPGAEATLAPSRRYLVTGLDPDVEHSLFRDEVFADVLGVVTLPAPSVGQYLAAATEFANDRLSGTLAAQVVIDPDSAKTHQSALDRSIADLRYGAISVNEWVGFAFGLGYTTWGGFPGHTPEDIGSGVGVIGNAFGLPRPQRTVVTGAFRSPMKPAECATFGGRATVYRGMTQYYANADPRALLPVFAAAARL